MAFTVMDTTTLQARNYTTPGDVTRSGYFDAACRLSAKLDTRLDNHQSDLVETSECGQVKDGRDRARRGQ